MRESLQLAMLFVAITSSSVSLKGQSPSGISSLDASVRSRVEEQSPETTPPASQPKPGSSRWSFPPAQSRSAFWPTRPSASISKPDSANPDGHEPFFDGLTIPETDTLRRRDHMPIAPVPQTSPFASEGNLFSTFDQHKLELSGDGLFQTTTPPPARSRPAAAKKPHKRTDGPH